MSSHKPFISLCMIVRDEESYLRRCLESFNGAYDELIVVDTGSQDRTVEIAREFDAQLGYFTWCDDFGSAKNYACSLAHGEWIIMPDGDEYLGPEGIGLRVPEMLRHVPHRLDKLLIEQRTLIKDDVITILVDRIFRNLPGLRWKYRIHEVIEMSQERTAMTREFYLLHENALKRREDMRISQEREQMYLRALARDREEYPNDPRPAFYFAETLCGANRHQEALEAFGHYFHLSVGKEPARRAAAFRDAATSACALAQHERQRTLLFRSLADDWRPAETYVALAEMALKHNNRDEAIHWFTVAAGCKPSSDTFSISSAYGPQLFERLTALYREKDDESMARKWADKAADLRGKVCITSARPKKRSAQTHRKKKQKKRSDVRT